MNCFLPFCNGFLSTIKRRKLDNSTPLLNAKSCRSSLEMPSSVEYDFKKHSYKCTRLIDAVLRNSLDDVKHYIEQGDNVNEIGNNDETALFYAIRKSSPESIDIFKLLLEKGAACFLEGLNKTALICAVQANQTHCVSMLLEHCKCCINITFGPNQYTALHYAVAYNRYIAAYLICQEKNVDFGTLDINDLPAHKVSSLKREGNSTSKMVVETFGNKELTYGECMEKLEKFGIDIQELKNVNQEKVKPVDSCDKVCAPLSVRPRNNFHRQILNDLDFVGDTTKTDQELQLSYCPTCYIEKFNNNKENDTAYYWWKNPLMKTHKTGTPCKCSFSKPKETYRQFGVSSKQWNNWPNNGQVWPNTDYVLHS